VYHTNVLFYPLNTSALTTLFKPLFIALEQININAKAQRKGISEQKFTVIKETPKAFWGHAI